MRELQNSWELNQPADRQASQPEKETTRTGVQTEWDVSQFQRERMDSEEGEEEEDTPFNEEEELFMTLENKLVSFERNFEGRLSDLEEQQRSVQRWSEENEQLQEENVSLRKQLKEIDLEEQKLKIWRESVGGLVSRVESKIRRP